MVTTILKRIDRRVLALLAVVLLVAVSLNLLRSPAEMKTVTAHFPRAVSVFEGTDVRVLGVNVGKVTAVIPEATPCASRWSTTPSTASRRTRRRSSSPPRRSSPTASCS